MAITEIDGGNGTERKSTYKYFSASSLIVLLISFVKRKRRDKTTHECMFFFIFFVSFPLFNHFILQLTLFDFFCKEIADKTTCTNVSLTSLSYFFVFYVLCYLILFIREKEKRVVGSLCKRSRVAPAVQMRYMTALKVSSSFPPLTPPHRGIRTTPLHPYSPCYLPPLPPLPPFSFSIPATNKLDFEQSGQNLA